VPIRPDSQGRFAGGGSSGASKRNAVRGKSQTGSRGQSAQAIAGLERSKVGLRSRARDTNKALSKDGSSITSKLRSTAAKELMQSRKSINQLRQDVKGSASKVGASLGGKQKRAKIKK